MTLTLDHIVVYAADIKESDAFYGTLLGLLGFTKIRDHVFQRGEMGFDLREALREGEGYQRGNPGVDHFGFTASDRATVDKVMMDMMAAGYDGGRITEFENGDYALFIADPDGVRFEITSYGARAKN